MDKIKNWIDIESSEAFKKMTPAQKKKARANYPMQQFKIQETLKDIEQNVYNSIRKIQDTMAELGPSFERVSKLDESNRMEMQGFMDTFEKSVKVFEDSASAVTTITTAIQANMKTVENQIDGLYTVYHVQGEQCLKAVENIQNSIDGMKFPEPQSVDLAGTEDMLSRINRKLAKEPEKRPKKWVASVSERDLNDDIKSVTLTAVG